LLEVGADSATPSFVSYFAVTAALGFYWLQTYGGLDWGSSPDTPAALCVVLSVLYCLRAAIAPNKNSSLLLAFFFAAFATAIKLSAAPVWILVAGAILVRRRETRLSAIPISSAFVIACLFVPWTVRGIILSGCFAYPLAATCIDSLSWSAKAKAISDAQWITAWARTPNTGLIHLNDWDWLLSWYSLHQNFIKSTVLLGALSFGVAFLLAPSRVLDGDASQTQTKRLLLLAVATYVLVALPIWFFKMPQPRFGIGHIFVAALLPGLAWLLSHEMKWPRILQHLLPLVVCLLPVVILGERIFNDPEAYSQYPPIIYQPLKIPPVGVINTGFATKPILGDQCWLTPPPCAPYGVAASFTASQLGSYRLFSVKADLDR
jgi:hypothetical protein